MPRYINHHAGTCIVRTAINTTVKVHPHMIVDCSAGEAARFGFKLFEEDENGKVKNIMPPIKPAVRDAELNNSKSYHHGAKIDEAKASATIAAEAAVKSAPSETKSAVIPAPVESPEVAAVVADEKVELEVPETATVAEPDAQPIEAPIDEEKADDIAIALDLDTLSKSALKAKAKELGLSDKGSKDDLLSLITGTLKSEE